MQFILEHISDIFAFGCISAIAIEKNSNIKFKPLTWLGNQVNSDMSSISTFTGTINSFYTSTDYEPLEEDWNELRVNVKKLRERLKEKYWDEIVYSDVEDMLYQVKHFSDCHFTESWLGTFYDYMNKGTDILDMNYKEMIEYSKTLEFDGAGHEIHSPQVEAWVERHKNKKSEK